MAWVARHAAVKDDSNEHIHADKTDGGAQIKPDGVKYFWKHASI